MEKKDDRIDIMVLIVLFIAALLVIVSALDAFGEAPGSVFVGSSIMVTGAMICRAMQWAGKE